MDVAASTPCKQFHLTCHSYHPVLTFFARLIHVSVSRIQRLVEGYRDTKEQLLAISSHYFTVAEVRTPHLPSAHSRGWIRMLPPDVDFVLPTHSAGWLRATVTPNDSS